MAHRKRWPVLIRPVCFRSSFCAGTAVSSSETGGRDTWQSTPKNCIHDCIENASICFSNSPVFCSFDFPSFLYWSNLSRVSILSNNTFRLSNFIPASSNPWINFYKRMKILLLSCLLFFFTIYFTFNIIISKYKCFYFILKWWK